MVDDSNHAQRLSALELWRIDKERLDNLREESMKQRFSDITAQLSETKQHLNRQDAAQDKMSANLEKLVDGQTKIMLKLANQDGAQEARDQLVAESKSDSHFSTNAKLAIASIITTLFCGFLYLGWSAFHH